MKDLTPAQKLAKIGRIFETRRRLSSRATSSSHVAHNLDGAIIDITRNNMKVDSVSLRTLRRVQTQLHDIAAVLGC